MIYMCVCVCIVQLTTTQRTLSDFNVMKWKKPSRVLLGKKKVRTKKSSLHPPQRTTEREREKRNG